MPRPKADQTRPRQVGTIAYSAQNSAIGNSQTNNNYPVIFHLAFRRPLRADAKKVHKKNRCSSVWSNGFRKLKISSFRQAGRQNAHPAVDKNGAVVPIARTTQHKHTQAGFLTCSLLFDPFPSVNGQWDVVKKLCVANFNAAGTHSGATVTDFNRVPFGYTAVKICRTWMAFSIVKELTCGDHTPRRDRLQEKNTIAGANSRIALFFDGPRFLSKLVQEVAKQLFGGFEADIKIESE